MFASLSETLAKLLGTESSDDQFASFIENGSGYVYVIDAQTGIVLYLSHKAGDLFPQSFFSLLKETVDWRAMIHEEDRPIYLQAIENLNTRKASPALSYRIATSKKNTFLPLSDSLAPLKNSEGATIAYLGRFEDQSFRIQAMDTLVRRSWKEVATEVTRRFMHDFNNMIAGIYSLSELYAVPGSEADTMVEAMGHIRDNSIRAQGVTQKIRSLSSMTEAEPSFFDLEKLIQDQEDYIRALLPKGASVHFELSGESLPCHLDANRFKQAILHLASNSRDAVADNPVITIRTTVLKEEDRNIARIEFQDNGTGIKERTLPQVQEPFFTSKDPQKNVGMGLFIVKSFAEELGGRIDVQSKEGEGTSAFLYLPISNLSETFSSPTPKPSAAKITKTTKENKKLTLLIYTWEDITRHPLINAIREESWKYRIHLDALQLILDINELKDELDGIIIFKSSLDEKAEPLVHELANTKGIPPLALIPLGESIDALPESITSKCALIAPPTSKPSGLTKKLFKAFS